ncbi:hypothetical protein CBP51_03135 [Cellvibrio mixtus]|uniref:Uncharacterized protein n=1 Tax=Cellvibrio mixtus TaxID=39650 RepID=A0A266Q9L2_9GAMM|nr:hypothetical protein [Cellvibrio mixtus]OZY86039.1 hypothetical protein CBP51_03135 [Cellvibrio mixtus]
MKIFRFVISAYPSPKHIEFHDWQKATLVIFVAEYYPAPAESKALTLVSERNWLAESFLLKDVLIKDAVQAEGGAVWDAYLKAEREGFFWMESLDALPMTPKKKDVWGTGPQLNEQFIDLLISKAGGRRVTKEEAGNFEEKNADYILGKYVLELKQFEQEGLTVATRQQKIAEIFDAYSSNDLTQKIDPYRLSDDDFQKYWDVIGVPIQKRIKDASKQVKSTISRLGQDEFEGGVILLNTGYLTVPHDFLVAMAERYAKKDTSSISKVIVISSWTITNGFDTVVNYGFHPHDSECPNLLKLHEVFWSTVENLMTQMITGELDVSNGMQKPMSPVHFIHEGTAYTFGVPEIESSLKRNKDPQ